VEPLNAMIDALNSPYTNYRGITVGCYSSG